MSEAEPKEYYIGGFYYEGKKPNVSHVIIFNKMGALIEESEGFSPDYNCTDTEGVWDFGNIVLTEEPHDHCVVVEYKTNKVLGLVEIFLEEDDCLKILNGQGQENPEPKKDDQKDTDFIQRQLDLGIE